MSSRIAATAAAAAALGLAISHSAQAQPPQPQIKPPATLSMKWLKSFSVSPQPVIAGTSATGTVILLRPAIEDLEIRTQLLCSRQLDNNMESFGGVVMLSSLKIRAGSDRGTFAVSSTPADAGRIVTLVASYGNEVLYSNFKFAAAGP